MIHPDTELRYISDEKGYGMVAKRLIPRGSITWSLDALDRIFTPDDVGRLEPIYRNILMKYTFRDNRGAYVLCWDNGRYINHSFNSNCLTTAYDFEIAVRDILPGEEMTDDYGYLNIDEPFEAIPERGSRRKRVYPDDLLKYYQKWDEQLKSAFRNLLSVEQPLISIIRPEIRQKCEAIYRGEEAMDSILNCYFDQNGKLRRRNERIEKTRDPNRLQNHPTQPGHHHNR